MRLVSCYIENFGPLSNYSHQFEEGLNSLIQPNGWGKSTFGVFVKAMLFGLDYSPRKKLSDNERKKYLPWNGARCGGNLVFQVGDKTYRVERSFGAKDKDDTFRLYDMDTGLESSDYSRNLGMELFRIDAESYARSTYFPQNQAQTCTTDYINARLGRVMESVSDMENYSNAIAKLESRMKEYKRTGNRGRIYELETEIAGLERLIEREEGSWQRREGVKQRREDQLRQVQDNIARLDRFFHGIRPSEQDIRNLWKAVGRCQQLEERREEMRRGDSSEDIDTITSHRGSGRGRYDRGGQGDGYGHGSQSGVSKGTMTAGIIVLVVGVILFLLSMSLLDIPRVVPIVCMILGIILVAISFYGLSQQSRPELVVRSYGMSPKDEDELERLQDRLFRYLRKFFADDDIYEDMEGCIQILEDNTRELENQMQLLRIQTNDGADARGSAEQEIDVCELKLELERLKDELAQAKDHYHVLEQTCIWLNNAKEQFTAKYVGPVAKSFQEYMSYVCKDAQEGPDAFHMNIDLQVLAEDHGSYKEQEYLSSGYRDLIGCCTRFALVDALFEDEKPFLILDDPFVNLDDEKMKRVDNLLHKLAEKYQIIHLVCHSSRT